MLIKGIIVLLLYGLLVSADRHQQDHHDKHKNIKDIALKIEKDFLSLSKPGEKGSTRAVPKLDIIFALDASNHTNQDFFEYQKNLTRALIEPFSVSPSQARIAIVSCSSVYTHFNFFFDKFVNKECVLDFIPTLRYQNKDRAVGSCLESIHWQAFENFDNVRKDAKHVVFIISGGNSSDGYSLSLAAKKLGVEIYGLSFGSKHGYLQLRRVVSHPISKHIFHMQHIRDAKSLVKRLQVYHRKDCKGTKYQDDCNRECQCKDGHRTTTCVRVRREFTSMSPGERLMFIRSFKKLTENKYLKKEYNNLVDSYPDLFSKYIHTQRYFLPWHRNFLLKVENLLRIVDCRVTIPFWNWTLASGNPWTNSTNGIWSTSRGLGHDGALIDNCVKSGPFRETQWKLNNSNGRKSCLRRNFDKTARLPGKFHIQNLLKIPMDNFQQFERKLRQYHHIVTCAIGGTMCSVDNIFAPEYLLISSFIDHIWALWQSNSPDQWPTGFSKVSDLLPGFKTYTGEVLQNGNLPGCIRVKYETVKLRSGFAAGKAKSSSSKEFNRNYYLPVSKRTKKLYEDDKKEEYNRTSKNITKIGKFTLFPK